MDGQTGGRTVGWTDGRQTLTVLGVSGQGQTGPFLGCPWTDGFSRLSDDFFRLSDGTIFPQLVGVTLQLEEKRAFMAIPGIINLLHATLTAVMSTIETEGSFANVQAHEGTWHLVSSGQH